MIFVTIGLAVLALVLGLVIIALRRKVRSLRDLVDRQTVEHARETHASTAEVRRLTATLRTAQDTGHVLQADNDDLSARVIQSQADAEAVRSANQDQVVSLLNQLANLEAIVRRSPTSPPQPEALWQLELIRTERTWRHSVAPSPTAACPFSATDNQLRLAVEIEAAALREEVGAYLTVRWEAARVEDPGRCLLLLRVAQELLAEAARDPYPIELIAVSSEPDRHGHREVTLSLLAPEQDNRTIVLDPPAVKSPVIDIRTDNGMVVTVR